MTKETRPSSVMQMLVTGFDNRLDARLFSLCMTVAGAVVSESMSYTACVESLVQGKAAELR